MSMIPNAIIGGAVGYGNRFADVPASEANALIAVYNATGGDSWTNNTNWLTSRTVGDWYGITVAGGHVTEISLSSNNLNGEWTAAMIAPLTELTHLSAYGNASLNCSFDLADGPSYYLSLSDTSSTITGNLADGPSYYLRLYGTSNTITGNLADGPSYLLDLYNTSSTITGNLADGPSYYLRLYNTSSTITGNLADGPSYLLDLYNTSSTITGGDSPAPAELRTVDLAGTNNTTANNDDILNRLWTDRDSFTYATPSLDISATEAPTGTVQDICPPTTPAEKLYNLAHAQCAGDTFITWTILYTGGSEP